MLEGRSLLSEWLGKRFNTQHEAAGFLGISDGLLSMLLSGARLPGRDLAVRIQEAAGIQVSAWVVKAKTQKPKRQKPNKPEAADLQAV